MYIIVASDGLWDVVSDQELHGFINFNSNEVAKKLIEIALERGTRDNVAILVIQL
jgi:serine/threonine protein phosphatase PrpC